MRRRTVATLIVLVGIATAVFVFAPVVRSSMRVTICNPLYENATFLTGNGCWMPLVSDYESPSCVVLGIGVGHDNVTAGWGNWSYYIGCPPKVTAVS